MGNRGPPLILCDSGDYLVYCAANIVLKHR